MRRPNRNNTAFSEVGEKTDFISARKLGEINFLIIILTKKINTEKLLCKFICEFWPKCLICTLLYPGEETGKINYRLLIF